MDWGIRISFTVAWVFSSASTLYAQQVPFSQAALFNRCYTHLTGGQAPATHPTFAELSAGRKTALQACNELLVRARILASTNLPSNPTDPEAVAVLNNFYGFFRSWFSIMDFDTAPVSYSAGHLRLQDPTEPALMLTHNLFGQRPYREVITGQRSVRAIRSLGSFDYSGSNGGNYFYAPLGVALAGVQRGTLLGIMPHTPGDSTWYTNNGQATTQAQVDWRTTVFQPLHSYGAGTLGSQSFAMMTYGFPFAGTDDDDPVVNSLETPVSVSTGAIRMPRRWASNIFKSFMCVKNAPLRTTDVNQLVVDYLTRYPTPAQQALPFRISTNCMSCHGSFDSLAATGRALSFAGTSLVDYNSNGQTNTYRNYPDRGDGTMFLYAFNPTAEGRPILGADPLPLHVTHRDSVFRRRPSRGSIRFRSTIDGHLIWQDITASGPLDGLEAMGQALSNTDEYYFCAATRFFKYFTGIEVPTYDEGDPRNPPMSAQDRAYKAIAIQLGQDLRTSQSLESLIQAIMALEIYRKSGMR